MRPLAVSFVGLRSGAAPPSPVPSPAWSVASIVTVRGEPIADVERVVVLEGEGAAATPVGPAAWILRGVTSNRRYVTGAEAKDLASRQAPLARAEATRAALIPIVKSEVWWELPQDDRRAIFEDRSRHVASTLRFLPAIARRLHHGRDLGEPFDFLTWFEWAPEHDALFDDLVASLRATEEWAYVEREIDLRLFRA